MTTNASLLGSLAKVYVSAAGAGSGATLVGDAFDAEFAREPQQAVKNSYDTGAAVARKVIRYDGDLTFKFFVNPGDGGQNLLRACVSTVTPLQIVADYAEEGNAAGGGKKGQRATFNVRLKRGNPVENMAVTEVTLSPDGQVQEVTY